MKIKAVIFDLDGTLTVPVLDFDQIRREMGLTRESGDLLKAIDKMSPQKQLHAHQVLEKHETFAAENCELNEGAKELLAWLRQKHLKIGILTRNTRINTHIVRDTHGLDFDAIIAREDGPAKPDAFGVLKLCDTFNLQPNEVVVVGDFEHDLQSAKNANSIAVLITTHPRHGEFAHIADYQISRLDELPDIIDNIEKNNSVDFS